MPDAFPCPIFLMVALKVTKSLELKFVLGFKVILVTVRSGKEGGLVHIMSPRTWGFWITGLLESKILSISEVKE